MKEHELKALPELTEEVVLWREENEPRCVWDEDGRCWEIGWYKDRLWRRRDPRNDTYLAPPKEKPTGDEKWEVRVLPVDQKGDAYLGVYCGETIVLAPIRNRGEGELIVAAVNAIRACAEPLGMDPVEFAKRLESVPGYGLWIQYMTDEVPYEEGDGPDA